MTKTPSSLQDLSTSLYDKAKTEPTKRFWGLYVHICKIETLQEAYEMAKKNNGAPGIDGSRSRPSKKVERRVFFSGSGTN